VNGTTRLGVQPVSPLTRPLRWGGRGSNPRPTDSLRVVLVGAGWCPLCSAVQRLWFVQPF